MTAGADLSMLVLAADAHWRDARWWVKLAALLFGERKTVEHLGCACRITVWRGVPYLWFIHEVRA